MFWDVRDSAKAIGIELRDEHYGKLVVEVGNPEEQIRQIQETAARTSSEPGAPNPVWVQLPVYRRCRAHGVVERCARSRRTLIR